MAQIVTKNSGVLVRGVVPPLVTPLSARDQLDHAGLERLLEHVVAGGVDGVFILGTTGEAPSLSYRLRRELISRVINQIDRRVAVLVGITDTAFVESIELAQHAAAAGADAVVLSTPYYFPAGQTELTGYIRNIVEHLPLPLVLYNMPELTKVWFEIETLQDLADIDAIVGIKDSSGDLEYFAKLMQLKRNRPDWSVMIGPEAKLLDAMQLGADGVVAGGANVMPRVFVDCYGASLNGDSEQAHQILRQIVAFQQIYEVGKYASRHIKATKCALSLLGICGDLPADPFHPFRSPQREQVAEVLREIGLLPNRQ